MGMEPFQKDAAQPLSLPVFYILPGTQEPNRFG